MGWLHATPKTEKSKGAKARIQTYALPPLPDTEDGDYLRDAFLSLNTGEVLAWSEIDAFSRIGGLNLEPWEAHLLKAMNTEYLGGRRLGEDPFSIPPYEA